MREICTSGSVGGEGGNILTYPASAPPLAKISPFLANIPAPVLRQQAKSDVAAE